MKTVIMRALQQILFCLWRYAAHTEASRGSWHVARIPSCTDRVWKLRSEQFPLVGKERRALDAHASTQLHTHTESAAARLASVHLKPRQQNPEQEAQQQQQSTPLGSNGGRGHDGAVSGADVSPDLEQHGQPSGADSRVTSVSLRIRQPLSIERCISLASYSTSCRLQDSSQLSCRTAVMLNRWQSNRCDLGRPVKQLSRQTAVMLNSCPVEQLSC